MQTRQLQGTKCRAFNTSRPSRPLATRCVAQHSTRSSETDAGMDVAQRMASMLVSTVTALAVAGSAQAVGLESIDLPSLTAPDFLTNMSEAQQKKLEEADESFRNSGTLKALLEKSEANKSKNKTEIQNKYCYRQAELGIGDCGGLRLIPGMTKSGKQRTPQWLQDLLGVQLTPEQQNPDEITIEKLLGPGAAQ